MSLSISMGLAAPGYLEHMPSVHLCLVCQRQTGLIFWLHFPHVILWLLHLLLLETTNYVTDLIQLGSLVSQIQQITMRSYWWSHWRSEEFGPQVPLPWRIAVQTEDIDTLLCIGGRCLVVGTDESFLNFPNGHSAAGDNGIAIAPTSTIRHRDSRNGFHIKCGAVDIHSGHCSAVHGPRPVMPLHLLWTHRLHCQLLMVL